MKKDKETKLIKAANDISFRLLATNKHTDYQWLLDKLKELIYPQKNEES